MTETLRVALIGCGRMGAFTSDATRAMLPDCWFPLSHAEAATAVDGMSLVALADPDAERLAAAGERYGVPANGRFTDYRPMLEVVRPDVVLVATRSDQRAEVLRAAIAAGVRGAHAEKPLASRLGDALDVLSRAERAGFALTYGALRRFMAPYRAARDLLAAGEIGELREVAIDNGPAQALMWTHPHSVDLMLYFAGTDVRSVVAACDLAGMPADERLIDGDPRVHFARLGFGNGVQGLITSAGGMTTRLSGTRGAIEIRSDGRALVVARADASGYYAGPPEPVAVPQSTSGAVTALTELARAVREGAASSIRLDEIATGQRVLGAIALSALRGCVAVDPASVPEDLTITGAVNGRPA
ncbi:Gfo/Idh/MocA family protein [Salinarimonas sp. NSM]|uniref:Gfo/Idh/MocA family protein n=1 Tax=Salinarimonas sp. NSM TaxID=3458003 RepID=UPI00403547A7